MKTSDKCLLALILVLFLGSALPVIVSRLRLGYEPTVRSAGVEEREGRQLPDSNAVPVPGDAVRWNRIDLGLRNRFNRKIDESNSIFKNIGLTYLYHSFHSPSSEVRLNPFRKESEWPDGLIDFVYRRKDTDSTGLKAASDDNPPMIIVQIIKYKAPGNPRIWNRAEFNTSPDGTKEGWFNDEAVCEWTRGRWGTTVSVPFRSCTRDSAEAVALRDKIRDRLFAYYKTLR
jgi:hypothetical protein